MRRLPQPGRFRGAATLPHANRKGFSMARKSKLTNWAPSPECEAAYGRIVETAHLCAAVLAGEKPTDDPSSNASPQALMQAMGMIWFLARIDPADLVAFTTGPGSLADIAHGPLSLRRTPKKGVFAQMFQ